MTGKNEICRTNRNVVFGHGCILIQRRLYILHCTGLRINDIMVQNENEGAIKKLFNGSCHPLINVSSLMPLTEETRVLVRTTPDIQEFKEHDRVCLLSMDSFKLITGNGRPYELSNDRLLDKQHRCLKKRFLFPVIKVFASKSVFPP